MSKIAGKLNAEMMKKVIHDRRAKLFAEIVAKTGSKQSVIDRAMQEIASLREQAEKLKAEKVIAAFESGLDLGAEIAEQLAALAEQNEKMREALVDCEQALDECRDYPITYDSVTEALSLPDLATPVLNRIRAEGMLIAAEICDEIDNDEYRVMQVTCAETIRARADELEKTNAM